VAGSTASEDDEGQETQADEEDIGSATGVLEEPSDDPQRGVIAVLHERQKELGDLYPFAVDDVSVVWKKSEIGAYDSLLAITLSHSFDVVPKLAAKTIEVLFEQVTARCLAGNRWTVHDVGASGRSAKNFESALSSISKAIDWKLHVGATSRAADAQEEGCDTLIMLPWRDSRPGRVFLIGQATVTKSENWKQKMHEVSPSAWGPRLQRPHYPQPIRFLAVPHHVERNTLIMLQEHAEGIVVDRLRLASGERSSVLSADERTVVEYVRTADIEI
jgi:hypothetical protein